MSFTPRALTVFYFIAPMILAGLLSSVLGLDISQFLKQYLGVLVGIEKGGFDIKFKSFNLLFLILFLPLVFISAPKIAKTTVSEMVNGSITTLKILFVFIPFILFNLYVLISLMLFEGVDFSIQNNSDPYEYIQPGARVYILAVKSDISFSLLYAAFFWVNAFFVYGLIMFLVVLVLRFVRLFKN